MILRSQVMTHVRVTTAIALAQAPKAKKVKRSTEDGASPKQPKVSKKATKAAAADDEGGAGQSQSSRITSVVMHT